MYFYPYGPFEIPRDKSRISEDKDDKKKFWQDVEAMGAGLSAACGCYIFTLRNKAWYIGSTNRQGFLGECFTIHKLYTYNKALSEYTSPGIPRLILIAKITETSRFSKASDGHRDIKYLEKMLIAHGLKRNPDLRNIKDTKILREMTLPGVINTPQGEASGKPVQFLKLVLGVR